jgi:two-component system, OmpR family, phosphate regulon response regulator PhoB
MALDAGHRYRYPEKISRLPQPAGKFMKKILIVEDNADIRRLVRMTLESADHEILEATDGESGLHLAQVIRPDLVLLDVMMPGDIDGLEVCRQIRQSADLTDIRVVLLTARGQIKDREAGLAAGANAYLAKPFSPLQLIDTVDQWLQDP